MSRVDLSIFARLSNAGFSLAAAGSCCAPARACVKEAILQFPQSSTLLLWRAADFLRGIALRNQMEPNAPAKKMRSAEIAGRIDLSIFVRLSSAGFSLAAAGSCCAPARACVKEAILQFPQSSTLLLWRAADFLRGIALRNQMEPNAPAKKMRSAEIVSRVDLSIFARLPSAGFSLATAGGGRTLLCSPFAAAAPRPLKSLFPAARRRFPNGFLYLQHGQNRNAFYGRKSRFARYGFKAVFLSVVQRGKNF